MCPRGRVHPDVTDPYRGEQLRQLLQEQALAERGGLQEEAEGEKAKRNGTSDERQPPQYSHCSRYIFAFEQLYVF